MNKKILKQSFPAVGFLAALAFALTTVTYSTLVFGLSSPVNPNGDPNLDLDYACLRVKGSVYDINGLDEKGEDMMQALKA